VDGNVEGWEDISVDTEYELTTEVCEQSVLSGGDGDIEGGGGEEDHVGGEDIAVCISGQSVGAGADTQSGLFFLGLRILLSKGCGEGRTI
jgi:hypothetical protein